MKQLHLRGTNVISGQIISQAAHDGFTEIVVDGDAVITSIARDAAAIAGVTIVREGRPSPGLPAPSAAFSAGAPSSPEALFASAEAEVLKREIVAVGKKLWARAYVDGNGGNISCRLGDKYVLCTPTLVSKGDLTTDDICLVDFDGNQVAGAGKRTSEIILHLEIMKAQPKAKACIHAHPPHATAYAVTGMVPPPSVIPEAEVFIGHAGFAPYGTPGTLEISQKVVELVGDHNTILLGNHGVVCWGDSVTHTEWLVEILETYCQTLIIASRLRVPIKTIPQDKTGALLDVKRRLDLPDVRFSGRECTLADMPDILASITVCPGACDSGNGPCGLHGTQTCPRSGGAPEASSDGDGDRALISRIADEVMKALKK